ncbi:MAG: SAM-dependent methyltransferase [Neisseriales bacterium]|nr:MAG: SAM-dependent methyltransferase [Neisseriales bacterium]
MPSKSDTPDFSYLSTHLTFPEVTASEKVASGKLQQHIANAIKNHGGWIPFSHYMDMALYYPNLGYYMRHNQRFDLLGDYTTAPELTAYFAKILARQVAEILPYCNHTLYEFGAGSGSLAWHLLRELDSMGTMPKAYYILDISPALIRTQQAKLQCYIDQQQPRVQWIQQLPAQVTGLLIGNELLDAMPCELIYWAESSVLRRGIQLYENRFEWADQPIADAWLAQYARALWPGKSYLSEVSLAQRAWLMDIAKRLTKGAVLLIDYGFPQREYYHPQRIHGTLLGHYKQHVIDNPLFQPGLVDLTAHVNFTAIAETAIAQGLTLVGYTTQANFLINGGILGDLADLKHVSSSGHYFEEVSAIQRLLSDAEMGDLFKVIGLSKNIPTTWLCFAKHDQSHLL